MLSISNIKKELKENGFVLIKGFFFKTKEFQKFNHNLIQFLKYATNSKKNTFDSLNIEVTKKFKKNKKISAFLNDNINKSPYLQKLLSSEKLIKLISKIFKISNEKIILNNQRLRVQIPGNDNIANLPWHQDSHYNLIKNTKSLVTWLSISKIDKNMGPIIFKKKSHKFGKLKKIKFKKSNGNFALKVNVNTKKIKNCRNIIVETNPGDLILIDMNLIHASGINKTKNKIKFSAQARYHTVKK